MKKIIFLLSTISIIVFNAATLNANIISKVSNTIKDNLEGKPKTYQQTNIGIEIANESKAPVWIAIANITNNNILLEDSQYTDALEVKPNEFFNIHNRIFTGINLKGKTAVAVWKNNPKKIDISRNTLSKGYWTFKPKPDYVIDFAGNNKTMYLKITQDGIFTAGTTGRSSGNLSLEKNVSGADIQRIIPSEQEFLGDLGDWDEDK